MSDNNDYSELAKPYKALWLTTSDNPYDPFEQFDDWYQYDTSHGYNTCALIARLLPNDRHFDIEKENDAINDIICRFIQIDPLQQYTIVGKEITPQFVTSNDFCVL